MHKPDRFEEGLPPIRTPDDSYSDSEEKRRKKKKKKEKKRQLKELERRQKSEEKVVPDPAVLAYVFNPFRMMSWDVPSVEKYESEIKELEEKRKAKQKEIEEAQAIVRLKQQSLRNSAYQSKKDDSNQPVKKNPEDKEDNQKTDRSTKRKPIAAIRRENTQKRMQVDDSQKNIDMKTAPPKKGQNNRGAASLAKNDGVDAGGNDSKSTLEAGADKKLADKLSAAGNIQ